MKENMQQGLSLKFLGIISKRLNKMKDTYISYLHKKMQIFTTFSIILMITLSINSIESFYNHNVSPHILLQIPKYNMKKTETK